MRILLIVLFSLTAPLGREPQAPAPPLSLAADSPQWDLQGQAKLAEYLGRKCLLVDGGAAVVKDFEMRDGIVDVDVATPASRGFFGIQFRVAREGATAEWVYLRQHKSGYPDAFLGIVSADDDIVYLPLKKGSNELMLAVAELGGGWGFICRLADMGK